jgi:hypothetical protein
VLKVEDLKIYKHDFQPQKEELALSHTSKTSHNNQRSTRKSLLWLKNKTLTNQIMEC